MDAEASARPGRGYVAVIAACVIWAGWIVATRDAMLANHTPLEVSLLRYGAPALLLAPIWLKRGIAPKGVDLRRLAVMTVGWGGPFVLLISQGMRTVEASLFGPLVPGLLPLVVALWEIVVERRRPRLGRLAGLCFIALAVGLILVPASVAGDVGMLTGAPWLIAACLGWSAFTIAFRGSGLSGVEAAAYVCLWSSPFLVVAALATGSTFQGFTAFELGWHVFVQGVLSGMVSVGCYGYALKTIGLARASAFTSLVPVLAALGGWLLLGEAVGALGWAASFAACAGVLLVNRYAA